ncbi:ribonuclease P protein subunit [Candidatus Woesearchaeota archaeon]|nr:ribonuclease P protein subunit [Candidatus Woesearchaeota archaeon]
MKQPASIILLGSAIRVVDSNNRSLIGIEGRVIDESKHTIIVQEGAGQKRLIKSQVTITVNGSAAIQGSLLDGRPDERLHAKAKTGRP